MLTFVLFTCYATYHQTLNDIYVYYILHEVVDNFCYLGDMLSVDGDADAAVEARIRIRWNKFRQLVPIEIYH